MYQATNPSDSGRCTRHKGRHRRGRWGLAGRLAHPLRARMHERRLAAARAAAPPRSRAGASETRAPPTAYASRTLGAIGAAPEMGGNHS
jgi:hypothetical protein